MAEESTTTGEETVGTQSSTVVEDEASEYFKNMEPAKIFAHFDADGSGEISLEEFTAMLPALGIRISQAKTLKYFKLCDTDGSGAIDLEEFEVAMFAMDPTTGNSTDQSGSIDEDEFAFVLEYLQLNISDQKQEQLFSKFDRDGTGSIDYDEFKQIWISVADVRKELADRGVEAPKLATKRQLQRLLEKVVDEEEEAEKRSLAEAEQWREWRAILESKNIRIKKARWRAHIELQKALDAAGQVYVFGSGSSEQFSGKAVREPRMDARDFQLLERLWLRRIKAGQFDLDDEMNKKMKLSKDGPSIDDSSVDVEALRKLRDNSPFVSLNVAPNTVRLWGCRVDQVAIADSVILALTDLGDVHCWGGTDHWWHRVQPDAERDRGKTTPRSQLLLGNSSSSKTTKPEQHLLEEGEEEDNEEDPAETLRTVLAYYDAWSPPPADADRYTHYKEVALPKVAYQEMQLSIEVRGKTPGSRTKLEMAVALFRDLTLERRVLGERAHRKIRELEVEIRDLTKRRRQALAKRLKLDVQNMWAPLREIQAEEDAQLRADLQTKAVETLAKREKSYEIWRKEQVESRRDLKPKYTPRGSSLLINASGLTARGAPVYPPRGYASCTKIAAGSQHLALIHQSGQLYTWGTGHSGRLGLDLTQNGDPRADAAKPTLVQALTIPVIDASLGRTHSACVTASKDVYVWGSANSGKLGLGDTTKVECFSSIPICLKIPHQKVIQVSCGAAHTACCSESGQVFAWGCGDGGRLGLSSTACGDGGRLGGIKTTAWEPTLVESLDDIEQVACGNAHTLARTRVREVWEGQGNDRKKRLDGGLVFAAGSEAVLGPGFAKGFAQIVPSAQGKNELPEDAVATQISAGFAHSGLVTSEGECYLWGMNHKGCCGVDVKKKFLATPHRVTSLYAVPDNVALRKPARMSSCYAGLDAHLAVDGNLDGSSPKFCATTQQDPQAWFQVDLGEEALVHSVKVWNRSDEPSDPAMNRDKFSSRLIPSWLMASQRPFDDSVGGDSLKKALSLSIARMKITNNARCTRWLLPENTKARYVRLQLENFDFLHIAQLQVFGAFEKTAHNVGRCGYLACGRHATVAVVKPLTNPSDIETAYKRAVQADSRNADILRHRETFALEFDKFGRSITAQNCANCTGGSQCEMCALKHEFADDLKSMPLGLAGRAFTLDDMARVLLTAPKPKLNYTPKQKEDTSFAARLRKKLADRSSSKNNQKKPSSSAPPLVVSKPTTSLVKRGAISPIPEE